MRLENWDCIPLPFVERRKPLGCYKPNQSNRPSYVPVGLTKEQVEDLYLSNKQAISTSELRRHLLKHGFKEKTCELCGLSEWLGESIPLELHHKDGNRYNNSLDNLMILCPTCHSWLTHGSNFVTEDAVGRLVVIKGVEPKSGPKSKPKHKEPTKYERTCPVCGKAYKTDNNDQKYCSYACAGKSCRKFDLAGEVLLSMFREEANYTKIAARLGVSDNAVKKRCKTLGIYDEVKELVDAEKRRRAIENQGSQTVEDRQLAAAKSRDIVNRKTDYYVAYTVVEGSEVELARFESTKQLKDAGYSARVVQRVCLGQARTYKGWFWRREPKVQ